MTTNLKNAPLAPELFRRELPCKLNHDELIQYGAMLSSKVRERDLFDDQRKTVAAEYSSKIKTVTTDISRIAAALDKGEELRAIDCFTMFKDGVMHTIRTDTGATVSVRPATLADRQTVLPAAGGGTSAPSDTDFPDLDEGPEGDELAPADPDESGAAAVAEDAAAPAAAGEGEDAEADLDQELDDEPPEGPPLTRGRDERTGLDVASKEIKHGKKRGPKGPRKKTLAAVAAAEQQAYPPAPTEKPRGKK